MIKIKLWIVEKILRSVYKTDDDLFGHHIGEATRLEDTRFFNQGDIFEHMLITDDGTKGYRVQTFGKGELWVEAVDNA